MRILVLGNTYSAKRFCDLFERDNDNIVFSTILENKNYINFEDNNDILEFCEDNLINLVLIIDEKYILSNLQEMISQENITVFCPSMEAIEICRSKIYAKKFMYKNKILTPKFQIAEKAQIALDYIRQVNFPLTLKPDNHNFIECPCFIETFIQAQKVINNLFACDNKKILIEDYIEGKSFKIWILSDGYSAKILGISSTYQNDIAVFNPDFVSDELKEKLYDTVIMRTINALAAMGEEYIGILGFDFILNSNHEAYLLGYNSFFDDINVDFFIEGFDYNWANIFDSTIIGDVFLKYDFNFDKKFMITLRQQEENKEEIKFIKTSCKSNLYRYLENLELDLNEFFEAEKIWKY